jgi:hypothetical protein
MAGLVSGMGNAAHPLSERANDCYETPNVALHALMGREELPDVIWEPACGPGAIVRLLRASGRMVYATDLVDYESVDQDQAGWDFLMETQLPLGTKMILSNPPFKNSSEFVEKALDLCPRVVMLLRLAFLESQKRCLILDSGWLAKVYVFRNRLPQMHRRGWTGKHSNSGMAFAWFVWDKNWNGTTEIHRISWEPEG